MCVVEAAAPCAVLQAAIVCGGGCYCVSCCRLLLCVVEAAIVCGGGCYCVSCCRLLLCVVLEVAVVARDREVQVREEVVAARVIELSLEVDRLGLELAHVAPDGKLVCAGSGQRRAPDGRRSTRARGARRAGRGGIGMG